MTILRDTDNTRINPSELRYLRSALAACTVGCRETSLQAIVVYARLHDGIDLSDEARYIQAEWAHNAATSSPVHLSGAASL